MRQIVKLVFSDGFPRTIPQADALGQILEDLGMKLKQVINIEVGQEVILKRLTGRRVCRDCGAIYHLHYNPSKTGKNELCSGEIYQRDDDSEATVLNRLAVYEEQTSPLIEYYDAQGLLLNIYNLEGEKEIEEITREILAALGVK